MGTPIPPYKEGDLIRAKSNAPGDIRGWLGKGLPLKRIQEVNLPYEKWFLFFDINGKEVGLYGQVCEKAPSLETTQKR